MAWVVNVQVASTASGFPAMSVTPPLPPLTLAVYVVEKARAEIGSRTAELVSASQVTPAATSWPPPSRSSTFVPFTVPGAIGSLNRALTLVPTATPVASLAGIVEITVGGVVSGPPACVLNTTSTQ